MPRKSFIIRRLWSLPQLILFTSAGLLPTLAQSVAQPMTLRGQLVDADTKQPVGNVSVTATSRSKDVRVFQAKTVADGTFSIPVEAGVGYAVCSESGGRYTSSCVFGKTVYVGPASPQQPLQLTASTGVPVRITVTDAAKAVTVTTDPLLWVDPLDLIVYVQESITRTRISLPLSSQSPQGFEYAAIIPRGTTWPLAMSSARHSIVDQKSSQVYRPDTPIPYTQSLNAAGESTAAFSLQKR